MKESKIRQRRGGEDGGLGGGVRRMKQEDGKQDERISRIKKVGIIEKREVQEKGGKKEKTTENINDNAIQTLGNNY